MKTFEQKIAETVNEKLNDGTVERWKSWLRST